jgi:putative peptidoglycan lipid II flippase
MSKKLAKSTFIFSMVTLLSRLSGFIRDVVFAQYFGSTAAFDAFVVAFRIPNFFRRIFGEGAFSQAFIPVLAEQHEKNGHEPTKAFINRVAGMLSLILLIVVIAAEILAPFIVLIFAPGFTQDPSKVLLTTQLLRIVFPYLLFISITAFLGSILNTFGRFAIPAFTPFVLNLVLIIAALAWTHYFHPPIIAVAVGVFVGGILQILIQWPLLKKLKLFPRIRLSFKDEAVRRVLKLMVPALFGVSVAQISLLLDNFFASFLPVGSISWLYYSNRLIFLPLGVVGVAIATVILPQLSREHARESFENFSKTLDWAIKCILVISLPAAIGLWKLAGPILAVLFYHGKFTANDVIMTTRSLIAFALGLPAFMAIKILASGFYSKQNIKTPVKIAAAAVAINILLNVALIFPLKHAGLALSTTLSSFVNAGLLFYFLLKNKLYRSSIVWRNFLSKLLLASIGMWIVLQAFTPAVQFWLTANLFRSIEWLLGLMLFSFFSYLLILFLLKMRPHEFKM